MSADRTADVRYLAEVVEERWISEKAVAAAERVIDALDTGHVLVRRTDVLVLLLAGTPRGPKPAEVTAAVRRLSDLLGLNAAVTS